MCNLHRKQHVERHVYCFLILWQQFWPVRGRNKPVYYIFTFLFCQMYNMEAHPPLKSLTFSRGYLVKYWRNLCIKFAWSVLYSYVCTWMPVFHFFEQYISIKCEVYKKESKSALLFFFSVPIWKLTIAIFQFIYVMPW